MSERTDTHQLDKYRNPDPRCAYPFTPDTFGYCWTYAHHVDGSSGFDVLKCGGCEFFKPEEEARDEQRGPGSGRGSR